MNNLTDFLPDNGLNLVEYFVILAYLLLMVVVGVLFKSFNGNISDFFRGGCRATWWLVGMSAFMSSFSAWTFTGAAGVAFESGWSVMVIFLANAGGFLLNFLCFGPWFRQLRAITAPQVIGERFNEETRQFYGFFSIILGLLVSSLHLYGLAIFSVAIFGLPIEWVIVGIGIVVLFYSTSGGNWAVMGTDFLQSMVLLPMTVVVAWFSLNELGGISALFAEIKAQGLERNYAMINRSGDFAAGAFTWGWICGMFAKNIISYNTINAAPRYFSVKDGGAARKAAILGLVLTLLGCLIWFIPPMAARLLYADQVVATGLKNPHETAYAVACLNLLPTGMVGLVVVAMFTATMSAMDTGINRNAAILIRDVVPAVLRKFKRKPLGSDRAQLALSRVLSFAFASLIITLALYFSRIEGVGIFNIMLAIGSFLSMPMAIPMFLGLFFKRVPSWSAMVSVIVGFVASLFIAWQKNALGVEWWNFQTTIMATAGVTATVFLLSSVYWSKSSDSYREKVDRFFEKMHTPVDFEKEIGGANDNRQLILLGSLILLIGVFVLPLMFFAESTHKMAGTLFMGCFLLVAGTLMLFAGLRSVKRRAAMDANSSTTTPMERNVGD